MKCLLVLALCVGCVDASAVNCTNGEVCPAHTICVALSATDQACASQDQVDACNGIADGESCMLGTTVGSCIGGACFPVECGNGRTEPGELCDDGNTEAGDGECSADCLSDETCGNQVVDPIVLVDKTVGGATVRVPEPNEQCDDGNLVSGDGCSSTCALEAPRWSLVDATIPSIAGYAVAYDSARRRVVYVGGFINGPGAGAENTDVWEWTGTGWHVERPASRPQRRTYPLAAYDAARRRVVLFGGTPGGRSAYGDTWEWDGEHWTLRSPASSPPARAYGGMVYDAVRKKIVMFGGFNGYTSFADVWEWDGDNWTQIAATGPSPRAGHLMGFDPKRATIVVAGGANLVAETATPTLDTWELANGTWTQITTAIPPAELTGIYVQMSETKASMAYDAMGSRFIAYGKQNVATASETYAYDGTTWTDLNNGTPGPMTGGLLVSDPTTSSIFMYGGYSDQGGAPYTTMWRWQNDAWGSVSSGFRPTPLNFTAAAYDPLHARAWVFGGQDAADAPVATLVSYDGAAWTRYTAVGPTARYAAQVAYDRKRDRLVVFGGRPGSDPPLQDTWLFAPAAAPAGTGTWSKPSSTMVPPARFGGAMTYDSKRERVVMFGGLGAGGSGDSLADTWEWDGTSWNEVVTAHAPEPRVLAMITYDELRGVVVLANGIQGNTQIFNDVWTYDGVDWTQVQAPTPLPTRLYDTAFAFDMSANRAFTFGGLTTDSAPFDDTWAWDGAWSPVLTSTIAPPRGLASAFPAPAGAGILLHGGTRDIDGGPEFEDTWRFRYENDQPRENCFITMDNDGDGLEGCADPDCWAVCTPGCPPGLPCDAGAPKCGDGTCSAIENCRICADCTCTAACGDGFCDAPESTATCPGDC